MIFFLIVPGFCVYFFDVYDPFLFLWFYSGNLASLLIPASLRYILLGLFIIYCSYTVHMHCIFAYNIIAHNFLFTHF